MAIKRTEGQIWISSNSPHNLHYYADGKDYIVATEVTYKATGASESNPFNKGILLALTSDEEGKLKLKPAKFPDDIDSIVGIVSKTVTDPNEDIAILNNGYIAFTKSELVKCMLAADLNYKTNGWEKAKTEAGTTKGRVGLGAPVYWSIGRSYKDGETYKYEEPADGKLTFGTPSGYKWKRTSVDDNSLNIGYDSLPQVGVVSNYTLDSNNDIKELEVQLNLKNFNSSFEWTWPYLHEKKDREGDCGRLSEGTNKTFALRPGIFATSEQGAKLRNYTDIVIIPEKEVEGVKVPDEGNASKALMSCLDNASDTDRTCSLSYSSPVPYYFRISGKVSYRYDKNHS